MMWIWSSWALAATDRYPACAEVKLAEQGAVRIRVPLALRSVDDPADGSDLVLLDAEDQPVPFARLEGDPGRSEILPEVAATADPSTFRLLPGPLPVDEVQVTLPIGVVAADVTVRAGEQVVGSGLVWSLPEATEASVPIRPTTEPLLVTVQPTAGGVVPLAPTFRVIRRSIPPIPPETLEIPVGPAVIQENGWARITVPLPWPLAVDHLVLHVADPIFSRTAGALPEAWSASAEGLQYEAYPGATAQITRVRLGTLAVESTTLHGPWPATDRLSVLIESQQAAPLGVERVTVGIDGLELVALDAGPGPHRLCGGAPPGTTAVSDLAVAAPELGRLATEVAVPGEVAANPEWVPPEIRANLVAPGVELGTTAFRYGRAVSGSGLVRIPLPNDLLSDLRPDLGDLRLARDGRQIPFLLRRRAEAPLVEGVTTERVEDGAESRIAVRLPTAGLRIARIRLATDATVFDRSITVSRPQGATLEPLRTVRWLGRDRPGALVLDLQQPVGDELLVAIDNGDDPPLPIGAVDLWVDAWELLAVLPEGGAQLLYGAPSVGPPSYDLALVEQALARRSTTEATLGERETLARVRLSAVDRVLLLIGVAALGAGLVGLGVDLVRRLPTDPGPA